MTSLETITDELTELLRINLNSYLSGITISDYYSHPINLANSVKNTCCVVWDSDSVDEISSNTIHFVSTFTVLIQLKGSKDMARTVSKVRDGFINFWFNHKANNGVYYDINSIEGAVDEDNKTIGIVACKINASYS